MILYNSTVTGIGEMVPAFAAEGVLVFFGKDAPEELHSFCIMHDVSEKAGELSVGDVIELDDHEFEILALGSVANENLMNLGHLNLKANGNHEAELPGDVCVASGQLPEVTIGTMFRITRR